MRCVLLLSVVALVVHGTAVQSSLLGTMKNAVNLLNAMYYGQSSLQFQMDFGVGVPLLNGKALVQIHSPLQFFQNSTFKKIDYYTEVSTFRLKIGLIKIVKDSNSDHDLCLPNCNLELVYTKSGRKQLWDLKPTSAWLDACLPVLCNDKYSPILHGEQVLPLLAQVVVRGATEKLSYSASVYPKRDETLIWKTFNQLFISQMLLN